MKYRIEITTDNDAFYPNPANELARILYELVLELDEGVGPSTEPRTLHNFNGNRTGRVTYWDDQDPRKNAS